MTRLIVHVYDAETGAGMPGLPVHLFEGLNGIEPPENAASTTITDRGGRAVFKVFYGPYRVGVGDGRYGAADPGQEPPAEWRASYSAWATAYVTGDMQIQFPLRAPPAPPEIWQKMALASAISVIGVALVLKRL